MRYAAILGGMGLALAIMAAPVLAFPNMAANCASCHSSAAGKISVISNTTTANPVERSGVANLGTLKVFQANPGQTVSLSAQVLGLSNGTAYSVELTGLQGALGVTTGGALGAYIADSTHGWTAQGGGAWYTDPTSSGTLTWSSTSLKNFTFDVTVPANAAKGYYDLVFGVGYTGAKFSEEHFYLQVVPEPTTLGLLAFGGIAAVAARRRRKP